LPQWKKQTEGLSINRGNTADRRWQTINAYLYQEKKYDVNFDLMNHLYFHNSNEPFVKYYRNYGADYRCVGFYKNDALIEETKLYNYIFENENIK